MSIARKGLHPTPSPTRRARPWLLCSVEQISDEAVKELVDMGREGVRRVSGPMRDYWTTNAFRSYRAHAAAASRAPSVSESTRQRQHSFDPCRSAPPTASICNGELPLVTLQTGRRGRPTRGIQTARAGETTEIQFLVNVLVLRISIATAFKGDISGCPGRKECIMYHARSHCCSHLGR